MGTCHCLVLSFLSPSLLFIPPCLLLRSLPVPSPPTSLILLVSFPFSFPFPSQPRKHTLLHFLSSTLYRLLSQSLSLSHTNTTSQAQNGHKGLPTSPSITAALNNNIAHSAQEESLWGYEEWSTSRHTWMRNDPFGGSDIAQQSSGLMLRDFSSYLGESPMFEATGLSTSSLPRFSTLEIVSLYL